MDAIVVYGTINSAFPQELSRKHHLDLRCPNREQRIMKLVEIMSDPDRVAKTPQWLVEVGSAPGQRKRNFGQKPSIQTKN